METAEIAAIIVVGVIAAAEIFCLFICSRLKGKRYPICCVIPVFDDDDELSQRLDYIASLIEDGSSLIETVLLIDFGGSDCQLQLCSEFCKRYHAAELVTCDELEAHLR